MKQAFAIAAMLMAVTPIWVTPASAAADEPVKVIMDLATQLWSDKPPEGQDYFDAVHIKLFSKSFIAAYQEAAKYPLYDENSGPFGYDVITSSQDGCPLKDMAIVPGAENAGVSDIKVSFKLMTCYPEDANKDAVSEVHFDVITEDGKPVISDIHRINDGKPDSLVAEMKEIAKTGAEAPPVVDDSPPDPEDDDQNLPQLPEPPQQ